MKGLPIVALLLVCALRPVEIHPEAAAGASALLLLSLPFLAREVAGSGLLGFYRPFGLFLAPVMGVNIVLGVEAHAGLLVLTRWVAIAALGTGLFLLAGQWGREPLSRLATWIGTAAALTALWQALYGLSHMAASVDLEPGILREAVLARLRSGRVYGPYLLPASLGGALALTFPLTAARAWTAQSRRWRLLLAGAALLQSAALIWTFSLGAWIGLAAAAGLVLGGRVTRTARGRWAMAGGVALTLLLLAGGVAARRAWTQPPGGADRAVSYRMGNWIAAAEMIKERPILGSGLGTFGHVFPVHRTEGMNETRYAHCTWLQLVSEMGIGALPLLALVGLGAICLHRRSLRGDALAAAAGIGALAFLIQNTVDFTAYQPSIAALWVLSVAIAAAPSHPAPAMAQRAPPRGERPRDGAMVIAVGLSALFMALAAFSDLARDRAGRLQGLDSEGERRWLALAARLDPLDPDPRGDLAAALAAEPAIPFHLQRALEQAQEAVRLDPRTPHRHKAVALARLQQVRPAEAWISLSRAAALYPLRKSYRDDADWLEARLFRSEEEPQP